MPEARLERLRRAGDYALTVPGVAVATWTAVQLGRGDTVSLALTPFALLIALAAWLRGRGPGVLAVALSALAIDFWVVEPGTLFRFASAEQAWIFSLFVVGWLAFCALADRVYRRMQDDRTQRLAAERVAAQSDRIAQLTAALGQARTTRAAIEASLQEPMFAVQADAGSLLLITRDRERAEVARAVGYPHQGRPPGVKLHGKNPVADAVGRGAPVILESRDAWFAEYPDDPVLARGLYEANVVVPLLIGSRVVAVVRLEFREARHISAEERQYLTALGTNAAQALDRTRELEAAERARSEAERLRTQADTELEERRGMEHALRTSETRYRALAARTTRLHTLARALSEAATVEAVERAVIDHGRTVAGATTCEVLTLTEDDERFEPDTCAAEVIRARQPIFIRSFAEWQERFPQSATFAADGGYESSATIPLLSGGAPIGVLAFHFTMPVNFDDDYQTLLMSVAGHCEQALERARLYESTQQARADAEEANRSKDEFVSIVSHELRTPLSAILGWATMVKRGVLNTEKTERALQSIIDNASRQSKLIDELLDFSRVTSGRAALHVENIELRDILKGVVESMIPTASARGVQLELSSVPPVHVDGDIRRLEQVFFNLIDNALKFTPNSGHVEVAVRILDGHVEVGIKDTGPGIEPEFLPFVFDRFRQGDSSTSRHHGGLGLGLAIVKELVQAHGGSIRAESEGRGQGATFTVTLPIAAARLRAPNRDAEADTPAPRLEGVRVLVVDDEADAREIMAHTLEAYGARVKLAANAHDALDYLEHAEFDALLADISMPEEDGFSLIKKVRASKVGRVASLPAAAVTALTRGEHREKVLEAGFQLHVAKPFAPAHLASVVESLARRQLPH